MANEKRLIDANEVLQRNEESHKKAQSNPTEHFASVIMYHAVKEMVSSSPTVDAVAVVFCDNCVKHGGCYTEDIFRLARIEKPYCCAGKMDGDGNG